MYIEDLRSWVGVRMTQRQNDTVRHFGTRVTLAQQQNDTVCHFGTVRHFGTESHFNTATK